MRISTPRNRPIEKDHPRMLMIVRAGLVGEEDARYRREISFADADGAARDEDAAYERSSARDAV